MKGIFAKTGGVYLIQAINVLLCLSVATEGKVIARVESFFQRLWSPYIIQTSLGNDDDPILCGNQRFLLIV